MAYNAERVLVAGTLVKIATGTGGAGTTGKSQTVNVCKDGNIEGHYREVYRSYDPESWVTAQGIASQCHTLADLDTYLTGRGFKKEGPRP